MATRGAKAWLITWEWIGNYAAMPEKVACILNSRTSPERVREILELLYANTKYNLSERLNYARRHFNPYPAQFGSIEGVTWTGEITCGHNPWLYARLVESLLIESDPDGKEHVRWAERQGLRYRILDSERSELPDC